MVAYGSARSFLGFILGGIRATAATLSTLPFTIQFVTVWLLALLFLLFNAPAIYGADAGRQTTILLLYLTSLAFLFSQTSQRNPLLGISFAEFGITFGIWVAIGAFVFKFIGPFAPERALLTSTAIFLLITHAFVVAISEELLFRFGVPSMLPGSPIARQVVSAVIFGFFHYSAYGGHLSNMLFASALGLVFGAITVRFHNGLIIAMALHFAWNAYTLGFL